MRFKVKHIPNGTKRYVKRFALLPVLLEDLTLWLEIYFKEQHYNKGYGWCRTGYVKLKDGNKIKGE